MVFQQNTTRIKTGKTFKRSLLAMCVMAFSYHSSAVDAQVTEDDPVDATLEEMVVTGQRANLQDAQEIKRNSSTFVDSISSEDIGSLPDRSVLEAMQRIPGISIERFAAANDPDHFGVEGSGAVIRGMSQTRSEFNGRDSFTANSGRGLSFQDVPPELMAGVDVYKNQSADMIEGGIGGTVSLRTRKPFDSPDRIMAFTADISYGDMVDKYSPTGSALYSDRWETDAGQFGLLLNVTNSRLEGQSNGIQSDAYVQYLDDYTDYPRNLDTPINNGGPNDITGAEAFVGQSVWLPNGSNLTMKTDDRTRKGYYADVQWESNDSTLSNNFQFLRSDADLSWKESALRYNTNYGKRQTMPLAGTEFTFDDEGLFQRGVITQDGSFSNGGWRSRDGDNPNSLRVPHAASWANPSLQQFGYQFTTNTRMKQQRTLIDDFSDTIIWKPNDNWEFTLDLQYIKAKTEDDDVVVMLLTHAVQDYDISSGSPKLKLIEPWHGTRDQNMNAAGVAGAGPYGVAGAGTAVGGKLLPGFSDDPAGDSNYFQDTTSYLWNSAMDHYERSEGDSKAVRFDTKYNFDDSVLTAIKTGVRYSDREQTVKYANYNWGALGPLWVDSATKIGWLNNPQYAALDGQWESIDWSKFYRGDGTLSVPGDVMLHPSEDLIQSIIDQRISLPTTVSASSAWENINDREGVIPGTDYLPSEIFITREKNSAAYVRFDFQADIAERPLKGNIGLRYVKLERTATGSVQYPDLLPEDLPPVGAPDVNNTSEHLAYLQSIYNDLLTAAQATPEYQAGFNALEPLPANPTPEQQQAYDAAVTSYNDNFIKADYDPLVKYAGDLGNFLTDTELGFANDAASVESAVSSYTKVLPSLNLAYSLTEDVIARFAFSKALANPDMGDVRNTTSLYALETVRDNFTDTSVTPPKTYLVGGRVAEWGGGAGNPYLMPMESRQWDASLEWYFAKAGSVTFTVFNKELSDFWVQGAFDRTYTNPTTGVTQTASVTGTTNNGEGEIKGFEFAYQQFFDMLPAPFDGVGLQFNYSYIDSESFPNSGDLGKDPNSNGAVDTGARVDLSGLPLQGQSKDTLNLALMYEKNDWSARLAYNWRSRYLLTTRDVISRYPLWNEDAGFLDGSINYSISDNLTVGMQFTNLLNTQTKTTMILDGKGLEAGRSWFENDRRAAITLKGQF